LKLNELILGIDDLRLQSGDAAIDVRDLALDSRRVKAGVLFAALPGSKADGRSFVAAAAKAGASVILAPEGSVRGLAGRRRCRDGEEPRRAFASWPRASSATSRSASRCHRHGRQDLDRRIRAPLWSLEGREAASLGTLGILSRKLNDPGSLTTPDPIALHRILAQLADNGVTHLAMEASSHGLDQHRLDGVKVTAAAFTNLSQDHLDYHADMASYFEAKLRLFSDLLPQGGTAVVNLTGPRRA
jgi:UDP-N-acetylmuramoyl-L-alanyl-D-glutamate--2,6-diaminopimelate ligase